MELDDASGSAAGTWWTLIVLGHRGEPLVVGPKLRIVVALGLSVVARGLAVVAA